MIYHVTTKKEVEDHSPGKFIFFMFEDGCLQNYKGTFHSASSGNVTEVASTRPQLLCLIVHSSSCYSRSSLSNNSTTWCV